MGENVISKNSKISLGLCLSMILATTSWYLINHYVTNNNDIKLFGTAVNQFGDPLSGAKVHYNVPGNMASAGSGFGYVFTDDSGNFIIDVHGSSLTIRDIEYPDSMYVGLLEKGAGNNKMYAKGNEFRNYQRSQNSDYLDWSEYDVENPFVFDVWVVDGKEAGDNDEHIRWSKTGIRIAHDGRPYTVELITDKRKLQFTEGATENGNIVVSCERDSMEQRSDRGTWKVTLQSVNGGIQSTVDRYLNLAPDTGYLPMIEIYQAVDQADYDYGLYDQRYYFKSNNGDYYGTLFIDYQPFNMPYNFNTEQYEEQFCLLSIEFKINTAGSRYLFKDRDLLVKPSGAN